MVEKRGSKKEKGRVRKGERSTEGKGRARDKDRGIWERKGRRIVREWVLNRSRGWVKGRGGVWKGVRVWKRV